MGQSRGQLPQRGQPFGAAHLGLGFLQVAIGVGQLFRGGLDFRASSRLASAS